MKRQKTSPDKSAPYRTLGFDKVEAPTKKGNEPKSTRTSGTDLRGKK